MKFETPKNSNYAAVVTTIKNLIPLEGCDNVVGTTLFGYQAIVGRDTKIGDIGLFFPAESQLSEEYCKQNNLFRHKEFNADQTKAGYIEDNRRVKAVKFRGHTSSCLFMPVTSIAGFAGIEDTVKEGDTFDEIDGQEICRKYEVLVNGRAKGPANQPKMEKRYDTLFIPEHIDTENWWKNEHKVNRDAELIITAKIHGTSIRVGNSLVDRKLRLRDILAKALFGAKIQEKEYAMLYGSKKVIKDINNPNQKHYYSEDIWTEQGKLLDGLVPEGYVVYAELVGWTPSGKPIQEGYTYGFEKGTCGLFVYRIAHINEKGLMVDLSWDQVKQFCTERGLNQVVELARMPKDKFVPEEWLDRRFKEEGYFPGQPNPCLPLSDPKTVDEGVCVRVEGLVPQLYKAKSPKFFEHETALLDKEVVDMETSGEAA